MRQMEEKSLSAVNTQASLLVREALKAEDWQSGSVVLEALGHSG